MLDCQRNRHRCGDERQQQLQLQQPRAMQIVLFNITSMNIHGANGVCVCARDNKNKKTNNRKVFALICITTRINGREDEKKLA